ncbi:hypothetical protein [Streptomyces sp. NPDC058280]|uniref:hypothetical protein n=1 Tax=Streptomyces sp. NPDC058280 TaxID=3346419 RepID=UPI0036EE0129
MIIDGRRAEPPSQAGTVDIALYRAADIDALPVTRTEINCKRLRPEVREAGDGDEDGRGLFLVAAPAADWGTDERRWGKIVWADLEGRG